MTSSDKSTTLVEPVPDSRLQSPTEIVEQALQFRTRQQEILAEIGVIALRPSEFTEFLNRAVELTAEGLHVEFCKLLEYQPDENRLLIRAAYGWDPSLVGVATIGADIDSPGGYALRTGKPVISNHLEHEKRFKTPSLFVEYGIRRSMNVLLQGDNSPYGVLAVDSRSAGGFTETDISFLQGVANIVGMAIERRRYETQLKAALDNQETLLREMNHRIRNSLQLVCSMLTLQASLSDVGEVRNTFAEASARVFAIARVHEGLYRHEDVRAVDIGEYLRDICSDLEQALERCRIDYECPNGIELATDHAIPLALVATELVTNAVKYAYPNDPDGVVRVRLSKDDEKLVFSVADSGVGLPKGFDPATAKSLGMRLIRAFTDQLSAELQHRSDESGVEFKLILPVRPANSPV